MSFTICHVLQILHQLFAAHLYIKLRLHTDRQIQQCNHYEWTYISHVWNTEIHVEFAALRDSHRPWNTPKSI